MDKYEAMSNVKVQIPNEIQNLNGQKLLDIWSFVIDLAFGF
ncbi:MAG: hypothetical protein ABSH06_30090 [Thermodesulfobacteriota bacterium]